MNFNLNNDQENGHKPLASTGAHGLIRKLCRDPKGVEQILFKISRSLTTKSSDARGGGRYVLCCMSTHSTIDVRVCVYFPMKTLTRKTPEKEF